jgi:DNA-binding NtrC family response regulator
MIVLIDDDKSSLISLEAMCEELDLSFRSFDLPLKAFQEIAPKFENVSLIICDYQMPELNGLDFIKKVKAINEDVPIILTTAFGNAEIAVGALENGAFDYVTKPINFKELSILSGRAIKQFQIKKAHQELQVKFQEIEGTEKVFIGKSRSIELIKETAKKIAKTKASILITGETGTGKEVVAKVIHQLSDRKDKEFVSINCGSIPAGLLESELFGHKKGAFTGADSDKMGLFHFANGGTLFLDEIGDMPLELQVKLLRVLQEGMVRRVGENKEQPVDVRIIAATHNNLIEKIRLKQFREDLYYRLNVVNLQLPSLRERVEDIALLADHFFKKHSLAHKSGVKKFSKDALSKLVSYLWPGNVRELENVIERACIMTQSDIISADDLVFLRPSQEVTSSESLFDDFPSLEEVEKQYILHVLNHTNHVKEKAAQILNINRKTLYRKIKDYNLEG